MLSMIDILRSRLRPITQKYSNSARYSGLLSKLEEHEKELRNQSDEGIQRLSRSLRYRAKCGESSRNLVVPAFALAREASRRMTGMRHFDVQIVGGYEMYRHSVVEMQTGEGKTLTATLPVYLASLTGKGSHIATVNDYLARRDAEITKPIFEMLGLSVGVIQTQMRRDERRRQYACDVTYATARELGFDFLRDRLAMRQHEKAMVPNLGGNPCEIAPTVADTVQRGLHFVLVDEADSVLIDDARTPLILSAEAGKADEDTSHAFRWAAHHAKQFQEGTHVEYDQDHKRYDLNAAGRRLVRRLAADARLDSLMVDDLYDYIERAIKANQQFTRERHYVVRDGAVVIVDESTGRIATGRQWQAGMHQAIEAQEGLDITSETKHAAQISVQEFFLRYRHLAGMTGTIENSRKELRKIYGLRTSSIPTNRPPIRRELPKQFFAAEDEKWAAIARHVKEMYDTGRPVLIGTRSIDKSEHLSQLLVAHKVPHQLLHAGHEEREAAIVARAGRPFQVTVATNMAGRGTDIRLHDRARQMGGLHVVCTELHETVRIDRQLIGRCGRQGDPGTYQFFLSAEDDILHKAMHLYGSKATRKPRGRETSQTSLHQAQRRIERYHFQQRCSQRRLDNWRLELLQEMGLDPFLDRQT
ncbi:MAG: preprotein translocase subunit SecA [Planctomycetaceae bacterium]|nr:translocase [Planctomycetales bacterium]MCB9923066.1 preprotein translocase subunit SecA [Planctomycetaceae bacterium]